MKAGKAQISIFEKMRIKNLRGSVRSDLKKLDSFSLETSKKHLIRNFLRNGRVRVNLGKFYSYEIKFSTNYCFGIAKPGLITTSTQLQRFRVLLYRIPQKNLNLDLSSKRSIFVSDNGVLRPKVETLSIKIPPRELKTYKKVVYTLTGPTVAQCENPPCDPDPFTYDCRIIDEVF